MIKKITILVILSMSFAVTSYGRIIVRTGDGRSAYSTSTTFFVQATDVSPQLNLSAKITTPSGDILERIDDPKRGLLLKDPNGLLWTSSLMVERPFVWNSPRLTTEDVKPAHAKFYCNLINARPPTLTEYKNLAKLFYDKENNYDYKLAATTLEPGYDTAISTESNAYSKICNNNNKYLTNINLSDKDGFYSDVFCLYGKKLPIELGTYLPGMTNEYGAIKCVVSPDMLLPVDTKKKYETFEMPLMSSCDPTQFHGHWKAEEIACSDPANSSKVMSHAENILFTIGYPENRFQLIQSGVPVVEARLASVNGFRGAAGNEFDYWFNSSWSSGVAGSTYTDHVIRNRKDKRGCDVYSIGISNEEITSYDIRPGYRALKSKYLFTIGKDRDGSIILRSNGDGVNFCHERIFNNKILQVLKLKSLK